MSCGRFTLEVATLQVHYIRPNRDVAKAGLKDLLSLAAQFLDGSLEKIFVSNAPGKKSQNVWQVDIDRFLV